MNSDWELIRSFLAVTEQGSLSAAARQLGVSQPTLSRDIQSLETNTGLNLFKRTTQGLLLTNEGSKLVDAARQMNSASELFDRQASGMSTELEGDVRISVNEIVGVYLLPPAIAAFRKKHPAVNIDIVISNQATSLSKRDADIALRMFRPSQPDLVAKRLPDLELGFYAHKDYVKEFGEPGSMDEFKSHAIIGYDESMEFINAASQLGFTLERNNFVLRTDNLLSQVSLGRSGAGIFATHVELAKQWPELVPVMEWVNLPSLEFWLVCHSDVQYNSRIREVMLFLGGWFYDDPYQHLLI